MTRAHSCAFALIVATFGLPSSPITPWGTSAAQAQTQAQTEILRPEIAKPVQSYAIRLTLGTHPDSPHAGAMAKRYVRYGASPRASQALVLAGKIHALTRGQAFVSPDDIRAVALPALRHRILLNFEGEADEVSTDAIVQELLAGVAP